MWGDDEPLNIYPENWDGFEEYEDEAEGEEVLIDADDWIVEIEGFDYDDDITLAWEGESDFYQKG